MLARSAENNPSVFRPEGPVDNLTVVIPKLLNAAEYLDNSWGNTKFLLMQYKPSPAPLSSLNKQERKEASEAVTRAKSVQELAEKMNVQLGQGKAFMDELDAKLRARPEWAVWEASGRANKVAPVAEAEAALEPKAQAVEEKIEMEKQEEAAPIAATA